MQADAAYAQKVAHFLQDVEQRYQVRVIHAVELGSRAWGTACAHSDFDLRFIYVHPRDWYLTLFNKKDALQFAPVGALDAAGWDLSKCLKLLYKGNASVYEWLHSPLVYQCHSASIALLKTFAAEVFNPLPAFHHYQQLAVKNLPRALTRNDAKAFTNALRGVLTALWVADYKSAPPVALRSLAEACLPVELQEAFYQHMAFMGAREQQTQWRVPATLNAWLSAQTQTLTKLAPKARREGDSERFDHQLRVQLQLLL